MFNLSRKEMILGVAIPITAAIIAAIIGLMGNQERDKKPAKLTLEKIFIANNSTPENLFGQWEITNIAAEDLGGEYHRELVESDWGEMEIKDSGIYILNPELFKAEFLKSNHSYIHWEFKSGTIADEIEFTGYRDDISEATKSHLKQSSFYQTYQRQVKGTEYFNWRLLLTEYLNSKIDTKPTLRITIRNTGEQPATAYGITSKNIFMSGGEAGAGGSRLEVANLETDIPLYWDRDTRLDFAQPIVIDPTETAMLQVNPIVEDAARGDGDGTLTYQLSLQYFNGEENTEKSIGIFAQSDGQGFEEY
ncbi:hypothetical protein ACJJIF_07690 [Microbulbifer sp. SSSA002]|uniref:hypothetical protein n=1 Tax=Microbulbifer sp. SSSA002 TaxID=3243376 RepID=UPI0040392F48